MTSLWLEESFLPSIRHGAIGFVCQYTPVFFQMSTVLPAVQPPSMFPNNFSPRKLQAEFCNAVIRTRCPVLYDFRFDRTSSTVQMNCK